MKGDFSKWYLDRKNNFSGVLHQQGRVLLDSDWNDQTRINNDWQDQAGQDVVGPGIAAVPVSEKDSFEVTEASVVYKEGSTVDYQVKLKVTPGRLWADGLLVTLPGEISVDRFAAYLNSPDKKPPAENLRDLVVLEVWKDSINGFQLPNLLIESALGGPDTTERVHTEMAFRLLRLKDGDTCQNIADKLTDSPEKKGKLTVSLKPGSSISTESGCPKVEGGGYTGLEHNLYRIEIADVKDTSEPMFKWSQFNGGLVGRGTFKSSNKSDETESESDEIEIKGNLQAIISSELNEPYLEVVKYDNLSGYWKVSYGAYVSLKDNVLSVNSSRFGTAPGQGEQVFFRLWNGLEKISDYQKSDPAYLKDGIQLKFDTGGSFSPQDYWTFSVRAGITGNESPLIDNKPPEGIQYHRVPLAIVKWKGNKAAAEISDCRNVFTSLTDLYKRKKSDCTLSVAPGSGWEKIFDEITEYQDAKVCFHVGEYVLDNPIVLEKKGHLRISGCGAGTKIICSKSEIAFKFVSCESVVVKDLYAEARVTGSGKDENLKNLNGVLTFCACPKVTVESVELKCAAGAEKAASCINVRDTLQYKRHAGKNPSLVPIESVRIHNCDLSIGHQQSGILLVNVKRANVENNLIQAYDIPSNLPLKVLLKNKTYRAAVRSLMIRSPTLGKLENDDVDVPADIVKVGAGKGFVRFKIEQTLASTWKEWIETSQPKGVQKDRDMLFHLRKVADRVLLNDGLLKVGDTTFYGFKKWYGKLLKENSAVGSQGIVAGGTAAEEIHIINNKVSGFMQGIHVGTSHKRVTSGTHDKAGIVQIMSNNIGILLSPAATRARHGIFVGNCYSLIIQNNYVSVQRNSLTENLTIDGIRVYGHTGRMMIVSQNHIINANTGILFAPTSGDNGHPQWVITSNVAPKSKQPVVVQERVPGIKQKISGLEFNYS